MVSCEEFKKIGKLIPNPYGIIQVEPDETGAGVESRIVYANDLMANYCKVPTDEMAGKLLSDVFECASSEWNDFNYRAAMIGEEISQVESVGVNGESILYSVAPTEEDGVCAVTITPFTANVSSGDDASSSESTGNADIVSKSVLAALGRNYAGVYYIDITTSEHRIRPYQMAPYVKKAFKDIDFANTTFEEMIEKYAELAIPKNKQDLFILDISIIAVLKHLTSEEDVFTLGYTANITGEEQYYEVQVTAARRDNKVVGLIYCFSNVNSRMLAEDRNRLDHDLLATAINTVYPLCFFANLTKNEFHMVDYGEKDVLQARNEGVFDDLIEYTMMSIPDDNERAKFEEIFTRKALLEAFARGESQVKMQHRQSDDLGLVHWVETNVVFVKNLKNDDVLEMTLIKTIDKDKESEELLRDALRQAESANKAKSQFLSNMSHDIRTPMNAIIGFTSIATKHVGDPIRLNDCLKKISKSSETLLSIINDVLDMSRIENEKMEVSETSCNLNSLINDMWTVIQGEMDAKNLDFNVDVTGIREPWVLADGMKINRIVMNLLSNSVKFTGSGGKISLICDQKSDPVGGFISTEIRVADTGIGMSEEYQDHIFEIFSRERDTTASGIIGTGLGLAIAKSMVDIMGGSITVKSKKDEGTEFTVTLPLRIDVSKDGNSEDDLIDGDTNEGPVFKRLLLVEDNELNREIAEELLLDEGYELEVAFDGSEAVEKIKNSEPGYFDVILMDIQMPIMNGYEAAKTIRSLDNRELAKIPIIAMTANVFEEDRKKAMASGMDDHIAKPIDILKVRKSLTKLRKKMEREEFYTKRLFGRLGSDEK